MLTSASATVIHPSKTFVSAIVWNRLSNIPNRQGCSTHLPYPPKTLLPYCSYLLLQCSVTCGSGLKKRTVECVGLNSQCDPNTKPRSTLTCNNIPCPRWSTGEWSRVWRFISWLISAFRHDPSTVPIFFIHMLCLRITLTNFLTSTSFHCDTNVFLVRIMCL